MPAPTLYLHIGRNKAGSTTLQSCLAENAPWLSARGIRYALFGHAGPLPGLERLRSHHDVLRLFHADPASSLLISNELIGAFSADLAASMAADVAAVNAQILFYVRPYREWVRSCYGFEVRTGTNGADFDAYLARIAPRISFWPNLKIWGETLGWHRVRVRSTHPADLLGGSLVTDFFAALGLAPPPLAPPPANVTPGWIVLELLRRLQTQPSSPGWDQAGLATASALHQLADESLARLGLANSRAEYLSRAQAEFLSGQYNRDLDRLHEACGTRLQPDDATAPPERPFLPAAEHIPAAFLQGLAERAAAHPEGAAILKHVRDETKKAVLF